MLISSAFIWNGLTTSAKQWHELNNINVLMDKLQSNDNGPVNK